MRSPFSLRPSVAPPRLTAELAAHLEPHALERSAAAMQALWEGMSLQEPWAANNHPALTRAAR